MRALLIGNPTAQSGKAEAFIEAALAAMEERGWPADFVSTEPEGRTVQAVRAAIDGGSHDTVIYLGGDGTFAEVAKGILASARRPPLGMLPSGTANDQGKSFGIQAGRGALHTNLDVIAAGHVISMDAGRVQCTSVEGAVLAEEVFFDSAGWGMQPDVLVTRNKDRRAIQGIPILREVYRDQLVYAGALMREYLSSWLEPTKFAAEIIADGKRVVFDDLTDLVISNTPVYGGEWVLDRLSDADDGVLELVPFKGRRELVSKVLRDFRHIPVWQEHLDALGVTHTEPIVGKSFELRLIRPGREDVQSQIDGEEWVTGHRFHVEVMAACLPVIVPEAWVAPWKLG